MTLHRQLEITDELYNYILDISLKESDILKKLRVEEALKEDSALQSSAEQVQFIALLIKLLNAKKVIEVGIYKGYSTLAFAQALPSGGKIIACDINKDWADIASKYWQEASVHDNIDLHLAPAEQTLTNLINDGLDNGFDLIFIDADKENYPQYYELAIKLIRPKGLIIIDNTLWYGNVIKAEINDPATVAIRKLNEIIKNDPRIEVSLIPIRDGLTLVYKK